MPHTRALTVEALEDRTTPVVWDSPWPDAGHLTVSFAPDGTAVRGQPSALFGELGSIPTADWQREALRALQTWAAAANINLAVVPDQGTAFGTPGPLQGDPRHGDIRLGATNLGPMEIAATTPFDLFGGWSGSVLLNTARSFSVGGAGGAADLYTVLLQEAGHALGVGNSLDPASAMFEQYQGPRTGLTAGDVADIQALYGARTPDQLEGRRGNGTLATATVLRAGTTVDADLTTSGDVDVYRVPVPAGSGPFMVKLTTTGISLLSARLTVLDAAGHVVGSAVATDPTSGDLTVTLAAAARGSTYFVKVEAARKDVFGIGAYRLSAGRAGITPAPGLERFAVPIGIGKVDGVVPLGTQKPAADRRWDFTDRANLSDSHDADTYLVRTRQGTPGVLVTAVWGLEPGGLDPVVTVRDQTGRVVPAEVLTDAAGVYTLQVRDVRPLTTYRITVVAADPQLSTSRGAYFLGVDFRDQAASPQAMATGTLTAARPAVSATVTLTQSELIHFALATGTADAGIDSAVRLSLRDQLGREVFTLFGTAGQMMSGDVLLAAGQYTAIVTGGTRQAADTLPDLSFTLAGLVRNDPIGIGPVDPSSDPTTPPTAPPPDTTSTKPYDGPYSGPYRPL